VSYKKTQRIEMENEILKKATVDSIDQCNIDAKTWSSGGLLNETVHYRQWKNSLFSIHG
jgi:hypothetical protein